ncbi:hypothetical protein HMPREF9148_01044 [Prevotella sp. F0091]|nr:hypothetical protein HMPREF9148_01044 [Prevotella sp. F0091]
MSVLLIALIINLANHCFRMKYTKGLIKLANILCCFTHQRCLCVLHFSV